jgi:hypothetical protein
MKFPSTLYKGIRGYGKNGRWGSVKHMILRNTSGAVKRGKRRKESIEQQVPQLILACLRKCAILGPAKSHFLSLNLNAESAMRARKSFLIAVVCLFLGFITTISLAQQAPNESTAEEAGAGASLVVTSVSGPTTAIHNHTISVTCTVKNQGTVASGSYKVGLYLSTDNKIDPAADRLLDKVTFSTGLGPGQSKKTTTSVLVPINGLSGSYYYGAVVGSSKKASSKKVSLARYSLADNNETVTDHQTGLIWQQADDGEQRTWDGANQFCANLDLGGKTDWRLPGMDELGTIIDFSQFNPAIDPVFSCRPNSYWSGSTHVGHPGYTWYIGFYGGLAGWGDETYYGYVRCVRSGP